MTVFDGQNRQTPAEPTYKIVRYHGPHDVWSETITTGLTLAEAQAHCQDPATSGDGWFDGYTEEGPA